MRKLYRVFLIITVTAIVVTVMNMDYADQVMMEKAYCKNVAEGIHPNYENRNCDGE